MRNFQWFPALVVVMAGCGGDRQHTPEEKYYLLAVNVKIPYWQAAANGLTRSASQIRGTVRVCGPGRV